MTLLPGEIVVDSFAGGGGASLGIQRALGRSPDIAINHDVEAMAAPVPTITGGGGGHAALVSSNLIKLKGTARDGQQIDLPLHTVQSGGLHYAEVRAFLCAYYGTDQNTGDVNEPLPAVTSKDRFALVTVEGVEYAIADIGMRMLQPRELYRAQGFPDSYVIAVEYKNAKGKTTWLSKTAQVKMCGNSVPPDLAEAIVGANVGRVESEGRVA